MCVLSIVNFLPICSFFFSQSHFLSLSLSLSLSILSAGPIAYSSPVPIIASQSEARLFDNSYDGHLYNATHLAGGLGKLVDGIKPFPNSDSRQDLFWVGWPRPNGSEIASVELEFDFGEVHNFTTMSINCLNSYSTHVRVFSHTMIWFSLNRHHWSQSPIRFEYQPDNVIELPRGKLFVHVLCRDPPFIFV